MKSHNNPLEVPPDDLQLAMMIGGEVFAVNVSDDNRPGVHVNTNERQIMCSSEAQFATLAEAVSMTIEHLRKLEDR